MHFYMYFNLKNIQMNYVQYLRYIKTQFIQYVHKQSVPHFIVTKTQDNY